MRRQRQQGDVVGRLQRRPAVPAKCRRHLRGPAWSSMGTACTPAGRASANRARNKSRVVRFAISQWSPPALQAAPGRTRRRGQDGWLRRCRPTRSLVATARQALRNPPAICAAPRVNQRWPVRPFWPSRASSSHHSRGALPGWAAWAASRATARFFTYPRATASALGGRAASPATTGPCDAASATGQTARRMPLSTSGWEPRCQAGAKAFCVYFGTFLPMYTGGGTDGWSIFKGPAQPCAGGGGSR